MGDINNRTGKTLTLYNKQLGACAICGLQMLLKATDNGKIHKMSATLDHIIPKNKGGGHNIENLRAAHSWCNAKRGCNDLTLEDIVNMRVYVRKKLPEGTKFIEAKDSKLPKKYLNPKYSVDSRHAF